jgi:hypothetical protein
MTPPGEMPDQQTPTICGNLYFCCLQIRCENGTKFNAPESPICPKQRGYDNTRSGAWTAWQVHVKVTLKEFKAKNGVCWIQAASCYDSPVPPGVCGNYPN